MTLNEEDRLLIEYLDSKGDCNVDLTEKIERPPVCLSKGEKIYKGANGLTKFEIPLATYGNFSFVQAPPKSYKTFFNLVGGAHLAHNLMNPGVMNFLDHLSVGGSSATNIEEIVVDELPEVFSGCNIKDLEIRQQTGCTVIGYVCEQGLLTVNPSPDFKVAPHSKLYVLGNDEQIKDLRAWFTEKTK